MANDQRITLDEIAVAKAEIERAESSEKEPETELDESAVWEGEYGAAGCPIRMDYLSGLSCGRKLHAAPKGADEKPVCLMHSKDPHKQSGSLFAVFWQEFEKILDRFLDIPRRK
jgi:hypothetical protein